MKKILGAVMAASLLFCQGAFADQPTTVLTNPRGGQRITIDTPFIDGANDEVFQQSANHVLSDAAEDVADKIAAGEVIESPVSIVKELVENSIDAGATSITCEITKGGKEEIRITDNGCGIPKDIRGHIFEKGFSTKGSGRGVGLYHTKQLIESLGGSITFESEKDIGSSFMVQL